MDSNPQSPNPQFPEPSKPGARDGESGREQDHRLVRLAKTGDELAFAELVRRHERGAWRVARRLVPSDEDARDLVQDAFLRVFVNLEGFDFKYAFSSWLLRIVNNLAIDSLRKRRTAFSISGDDEDDPEPGLMDPKALSPSAAMEQTETAAEVQACLETLAPHFQSALVLRELEGLGCMEIAEIVDATHVTVRWRLHRGRKLFQEEWERRARIKQTRAAEPGGGANKDAARFVDPAEQGPEPEPRT
ncbi:MAG: sigma-70 family RNA polymerase sigma factor [bacterium]|nr:sigma-70 family RNA polymerase sigma factor [Planctomycetota bacterium]HIL51570.1 sigma-70 family RNA polymerase sigma factor [Planctomycetota bacterium]